MITQDQLISEYAAMECSGSRHGATHDQWLAENVHVCGAVRHHTNLAWLAGCRSSAAVAAHEKAVRRKQDADRVRRSREYARQYDSASRKVLRKTGGRLYRDPRSPWRNGKMAVDRNNLWQLMHGVADSPTVGEMVAAVARREHLLVPDSPWTSRLIENIELAKLLKLNDDRQVYRLRKIRERLRGERTARRLADVKWRAAVAAEAPHRKERERAVHEAARKRRVNDQWRSQP
jgi:hypothetical protein